MSAAPGFEPAATPPNSPNITEGDPSLPLEFAPPIQILKRLVLALAFLVVTLGCSHQPNGTTRNAAAEADLNVWEGTFSDGVQPEKPGTVTPAHSLTIKGGRVLQIGKHVPNEGRIRRTRKRLAMGNSHRRSIVKGFYGRAGHHYRTDQVETSRISSESERFGVVTELEAGLLAV
jgi:hypothetical protein